MTTIRNNSGETEQKLPYWMVNADADFNDQAFQDFVNISENIVRTTQARRSQRKRSKARSSACEGLYESITIDDDQFLKALEGENVCSKERDRSALIKSIDDLIKYFEEDVDAKEANFFTSSHAKKSTRGKVATAMASLRKKCTFPLFKKKTPLKVIKTTSIQELRKKYEGSMKADGKESIKSANFRCGDKVKELALFFNNNTNSIVTNSSPIPQSPESSTSNIDSLSSPEFTSTPTCKSSPHFERKPPPQTPSISSISNNSVMENQSNTSFIESEKEFFQLSVKDKVSLFNKFIECTTKQNPTASSQAESWKCKVKRELPMEEIVFENQNSAKNSSIAVDMSKQSFNFTKLAETLDSHVTTEKVVLENQNYAKGMTKQSPKFTKIAEALDAQEQGNHLRFSLEANLKSNKPLTVTLKGLKKSTTKKPLDTSCKSPQSKDVSQTSDLEDDSQVFSHVSNLKVVLKYSPEAKKCPTQADEQSQKEDFAVSENYPISHQPLKRKQATIRPSFSMESLAPPKKSWRQEFLAPKTVFQDTHLEELFYRWLNEKNGVAFDVTAIDNKKNEIEIVPKDATSGQVLPTQDLQRLLEDAVENSVSSVGDQSLGPEDNTNKGIIIIKNTLDNQNSLEQSVIEIELPLEGEQQAAKSDPTGKSDSALTNTNKTTTELNSHKVASPINKSLNKKKVSRRLMMKVTQKPKISSTDTKPDNNKENAKTQSSDLPTATKPYNYVKKIIFDRFKTEKELAEQQNNECSFSALHNSLIKRMNSPSKIRTAYTLTVLSTPSPPSESDFHDIELSKSNLNGISRSCPSLLDTDLISDISFLQDRSASEELDDFVPPKLLQEQQNSIMESCTNQGCNTGSNDINSPVKINIAGKYNVNKSAGDVEFLNAANTQLRQQRQQAGNKAVTISPIASNCIQTKAANLSKEIAKEDLFADVEPERESAPSSLNEYSPYRPSSLNVSLRSSYNSYLNGSSPSSQTSIEDSGNFSLNITLSPTSQFWISTGDFTATITINHYEPGRLMFLNTIYAQKGLQSNEMNFGIDDQKFCLHSSATCDEVIKQVPQTENSSQYWFSTGEVLMPFQGPYMKTEKIQKFFNYIREFMEETNSLRFGIDGYEFSNIYKITPRSVTPINGCPWTKIVASPLKTRNLQQSDLNAKELEENRNFSRRGSLGQILQKFTENRKFFTAQERLNTAREEETELKVFKDYYPATETRRATTALKKTNADWHDLN